MNVCLLQQAEGRLPCQAFVVSTWWGWRLLSASRSFATLASALDTSRSHLSNSLQPTEPGSLSLQSFHSVRLRLYLASADFSNASASSIVAPHTLNVL